MEWLAGSNRSIRTDDVGAGDLSREDGVWLVLNLLILIAIHRLGTVLHVSLLLVCLCAWEPEPNLIWAD